MILPEFVGEEGKSDIGEVDLNKKDDLFRSLHAITSRILSPLSSDYSGCAKCGHPPTQQTRRHPTWSEKSDDSNIKTWVCLSFVKTL